MNPPNQNPPDFHHRRSIRLKGYDYSGGGAYFITICTHDRKPFFGQITSEPNTPIRASVNHAHDDQLGYDGQPQGLPLPGRTGNTMGARVNDAHDDQLGYDGQPQGLPLPGRMGDTIEAGVNHAPTRMELNEFGFIALEQWHLLNDRFPNIELDAFVVMPNHIHGIIFITENRQPQQNTTLGDIVGAYKSLVSKECLEIYKTRNETMGKLWQRNYYEHIIRNEKSYATIAAYIENNPTNWQKDELFIGEML